MVGDFIKLDRNESHIYSIAELKYCPLTEAELKGGHLVPTLKMVCFEFVAHNSFEEETKSPGPEDCVPREHIKLPFQKELSAGQPFEKVTVTQQVDGHEAYYVSREWDGVSFAPYNLPQPNFTLPEVEQGESLLYQTFHNNNLPHLNPAIIIGLPHVWVEVFIDSFKPYEKNRSTTGVYIGFSNVRSKYKYNRRQMYTLMLLPPHVPLFEALAPLRRDLGILESGIIVDLHPKGSGEAKQVRVTGAVSMLISDHVQACANSCHMGNQAKKNCRMCMADRSQRFETSRQILDFTQSRCLGQAAAVVEQINLTLGAEPSAAKVKSTRSLYGVTTGPLPLGNYVDPFRQSIPCIGHCLDLGLMSRILAFTMKRLTLANLGEFNTRLKSMDTPRGWVKLTPYTAKLKGRLGEPMKTSRKLALCAFYLLEGLVESDLLALVTSLLDVRASLMQRGHTDGTIALVNIIYVFVCCFCFFNFSSFWQQTQEKVRQWVGMARDIHQKYNGDGLTLDVPNIHLLVEAAMRSLPLIGDLRSAMTNRYEAMHQANIHRIGDVSYTTGSNPENFAIQQSVFDDALRFVMNGGRWGPGLEFVAAKGLRERIALTFDNKVFNFICIQSCNQPSIHSLTRDWSNAFKINPCFLIGKL